MNTFDAIIIGGGVSGFFSAIKLLECNEKISILILEKENTPLKKLLTTGSGACNFTHTGSLDDFLLKYGNNGQFLRNAFNNYFVDDIVYFFENNGVRTMCRDDGKYFPSSMKAKEIKDLFLSKLKNISIHVDEAVTEIKKNDTVFSLTTCKNVYHSKAVIIATGGKSFPHTGSTGDGYIFAKSFGHTVIPLKPSLASIYCDNHTLSCMSGISFSEAKVCISKKKAFSGPLLITHKGFSGPVIIDNSRNFSIGETITISFIQEKRENLESYLKEIKNEVLGNALKKYAIPKKLIQLFCERLSIDPQKKLGEVSHKNISLLLDLITAYSVKIDNIEGYDTCMCTAGGLSLKEVNPKTFESKIVSGLYFLGEVLDIDGDSGGYNLQAIWSECALFAENFRV